jgi:uncharacterized OsmC-like protein
MKAARIATALEILSATLSGNPERARTALPPVRALLLNGLTCRVTGTAGEQIDTDMPPSMGGGGSFPSPGWLFRAALAACSSTVIAMQAARLGIQLNLLEVSIEASADTRGILGQDDTISAGYSSIRTEVRIGSENAKPEQLIEIVHWANSHSPVCCTVRDAPANTLHVVVV